MINNLKNKPFNLAVGMEVVGHPVGNYERGCDGVRVGKITKIGRKYFYVRFGESPYETKVSMETFSSYGIADTNGGYVIFPSMEDYQFALSIENRRTALRDIFGTYKKLHSLSDEVVNRVYSILTEEGLI